MEDILFDLGISAILRVLKDPQKKPKVRKALLKIFRAIKAAFPGDDDFK